MPTSPEDLFAYLASLSIETETVEHPALHTVEDSRALRGDIRGGHTKNLFVKDKKSNLFLLVLGEATVVDLKRVHETIGAQGRVSFGSAELLEEVCGVQPGAVTPFGAINDKAGQGSRRAGRSDDAPRTAEFSPAGQHPHHRACERRPDQIPARDRT
jgi:Ala-tRNA(Pro) deacylase